jgi:hypothetical protein
MGCGELQPAANTATTAIESVLLNITGFMMIPLSVIKMDARVTERGCCETAVEPYRALRLNAKLPPRCAQFRSLARLIANPYCRHDVQGNGGANKVN